MKTGLAPDLPEDLYHMIKKAVAIRKHLERYRKVCCKIMHSMYTSIHVMYDYMPSTSGTGQCRYNIL